MPKLAPHPASTKAGKAKEVLDLTKFYYCAKRGCRIVSGAVCGLCNQNDPPGCTLLVQFGHAYGWSDSNCRYEDLGEVSEEWLSKTLNGDAA